MSVYATQTALIDLGAGECDGEECVYIGPAEVTLDPHDGTGEYRCPGCGVYRTIQMFERED